MLHNVSIIHSPCIFQLKNHGARNGNVGPVARVNFTRGVFSNGVEEKSPALLPFCPAAKVEKKLEQIFSPARNVFTIYDIRIKLISEIKSWYRNFFRLFSCFRKSNKWRGLLVARGGGTVINFTGKLIRSWTRYEWAREQCGINRLVIKTVQLAQRLQDRARDIRIWLTSLSFKQLLEFSRYKQRLYN